MTGIALAALLVGNLSCTGKKNTQLMVSVQTDVRIPKDLNSVTVTVMSYGAVQFTNQYDVGPGGMPLPATLGIVPASDTNLQPVDIEVRGQYLDRRTGEPVDRVIRRARVTFAKDRIALLRMPLRFACVDKLDCPEGETCTTGRCEPIPELNAAELPEYREADVFGATARMDVPSEGCFDAPRCLAAALPLREIDATRCEYEITSAPVEGRGDAGVDARPPSIVEAGPRESGGGVIEAGEFSSIEAAQMIAYHDAILSIHEAVAGLLVSPVVRTFANNHVAEHHAAKERQARLYSQLRIVLASDPEEAQIRVAAAQDAAYLRSVLSETIDREYLAVLGIWHQEALRRMDLVRLQGLAAQPIGTAQQAAAAALLRELGDSLATESQHMGQATKLAESLAGDRPVPVVDSGSAPGPIPTVNPWTVEEGGYVVSGAWHGYAHTSYGEMSSIKPIGFESVPAGGSLCVSGMVGPGVNEHADIVYNVNETRDYAMGTHLPQGTGIAYALGVGGSYSGPWRVVLEGVAFDGPQRWCALADRPSGFLPWSRFITDCEFGSGESYMPSTPIRTVRVGAVSLAQSDVPFDFCLRSLATASDSMSSFSRYTPKGLNDGTTGSPSAGGAQSSGLVVALSKRGGKYGFCSGEDCRIPLDEDQELWTYVGDSAQRRIRLAPGLCERMRAGAFDAVLATTTCGSKPPSRAICESTSSASESGSGAGTVTVDAGGTRLDGGRDSSLAAERPTSGADEDSVFDVGVPTAAPSPSAPDLAGSR